MLGCARVFEESGNRELSPAERRKRRKVGNYGVTFGGETDCVEEETANRTEARRCVNGW